MLHTHTHTPCAGARAWVAPRVLPTLGPSCSWLPARPGLTLPAGTACYRAPAAPAETKTPRREEKHSRRAGGGRGQSRMCLRVGGWGGLTDDPGLPWLCPPPPAVQPRGSLSLNFSMGEMGVVSPPWGWGAGEREQGEAVANILHDNIQVMVCVRLGGSVGRSCCLPLRW